MEDQSQGEPQVTRVGFKEWAMVCDALMAGATCLILRKGGIAEGRGGFQWRHDSFFLFPTHFHEQEKELNWQPSAVTAYDAEQRDQVIIRARAEIVAKATVADWAVASALSGHHVWREHVVKDRFGWGKEEAISLAVLRVHTLVEPWGFLNTPAYGGCKSWIDLPEGRTVTSPAVQAMPEEAIQKTVSDLRGLGVVF